MAPKKNKSTELDEEEKEGKRAICQQILMHPENIKSIIPEFDNSEVKIERWINKIEKYRSLYNWSDAATLLYAITRLGGAPKLFYEAIDSDIKSFESLKNALIKQYGHVDDEADVFYKLTNNIYRKDQTYEMYVMKMYAIGASGGLSEPAIVKYILRGLSRDDIYNWINKPICSSIHELTERIKWAESNIEMRLPNKEMKEFLGNNINNNNIKKKTEGNKSNSGYNREVKCHNCGGYGHKAEHCTRAVKCYNCLQSGHRAPECKQAVTAEKCARCNKLGHNESRCRVNMEGIGKKVYSIYATPEPQKKQGQMKVNTDGMLTSEVIVNNYIFKVNVLLDLGSSVSIIKENLLDNLDETINLDEFTSMEVCGVNDSKVNVKGILKGMLGIEKKLYPVKFLVVPVETMKVDAILGRDFINSNNFSVVEIVTEEGNENNQGSMSEYNRFDVHLMQSVIDLDDEFYEEVEPVQLDVGDSLETKGLEREVVQLYLEHYKNRTSDESKRVGQEVEIKLKEDRKFSVTPKRLSTFERVELNNLIEDLLQKQIIRESQSSYSSRVVLLKKKNGTYRLCVNYRPLNKLVEQDRYPLPVIESQLEKLQGKQYFTSLDLANGFYHIDLEENSKKYTAFVTEDGLYEFNKLPFGYVNSPAVFVRYINRILSDFIKAKEIIVFIDDILIATQTKTQHLEILKRVLIRLSECRVKLQLGKCKFLKTSIEYLGYYITHNRISLADKHISTIKEYPLPIDRKSLHRFIGLVSYFRKFIKNFSFIITPLLDQLKSKEDFHFGNEEAKSFYTVKEKLISHPVLRIYSPEAETELHTDASAIGFGGILMQRQQDDGKFHPVMYYSKKTTSAEAKLHSFELETLAIVYSLKRFRTYLFGLKFVIVSDCNALKFTIDKIDLNPKIARWFLYLEQFDYTIAYRRSENMRHVDALSRATIYTLETVESNSIFEESLIIEQSLDDNIKKLKEMILDQGEHKEYEIREGLVYKKMGDKLLLVVPEKMQESVIFKNHNEIGHFGVDKVCEVIRRLFYFPKMREKVLKHIRNCVVCIAYNPKVRVDRMKLHNIDKGNTPFEMVHVDHLGPLQISKGKNVFVFAIIDGFTKYLRLFATKTTNVKEVLKHIKSYIFTYSTPKVLVSDRGSAFTSIKFQNFVKEYGIKHVLNATACPQANAQIERYNRTLVPLLSKLIEEKGKDWDTCLVDAEFLLNNTWNRSIQEIPSKLLFGVIQKRKLDEGLIGFLEELNNREDRNLNELREKASQNIVKLQRYNKQKWDEKCSKEPSYKEGDLVVVKNNKVLGERNKLKRKYKGPYIIRKVLDKDRYVVGDIGNDGIKDKTDRVLDPSYIRLWRVQDTDVEDRRIQVDGSTDRVLDEEYEEVEFLDSSDSDLEEEFEQVEYLDDE